MWYDEDEELDELLGGTLKEDKRLYQQEEIYGEVAGDEKFTGIDIMGKRPLYVEVYGNDEYEIIEGLQPLTDDLHDMYFAFVNNGIACYFANTDLLEEGSEIEYNQFRANVERTAERVVELMGNNMYLVFKEEGDDQLKKYQVIHKDRIEMMTYDFLNSYYDGYSGLSGSDQDWIAPDLLYKNPDNYIVQYFDPTRRRGNNGQYFRYVHNTNFDLKMLQIVSDKDTFETHQDVNEDHCLINAIRVYVSQTTPRMLAEIEPLLQSMKIKIGNRQFRKSDIAKILPDFIELEIVKYNDDTTRGTVYKHLSPNARKDKSLIRIRIKLFLFKEHYMPNIKIPGNKLGVIKPEKYNPHVTTHAITIVMEMWKNKNFIPSKFACKVGEITDNEVIKHINIETEQRLHTRKVLKPKDQVVIYADFEALVYRTKSHLPVLLGWIDTFDNFNYIIAKNKDQLVRCTIFTEMLNELIKRYTKNEDGKVVYPNFRIYFHNLKYDYSLIKRNKFLSVRGELERNGSIYNVQFSYKKVNFELVDSYKCIPEKLDDFASTFGLQYAKMKFDLYNILDLDNFTKDYIDLDYFKKILKEREGIDYNEEDFKKYVKGNRYHHVAHYLEYLRLDCLTLKQGMTEFAKHIKAVTDMSIFDFLTISSLGKTELSIKGCLDETYEVTGNLQKYLGSAMVGGQVCLRNNEKIIVNEAVNDFDAVNLYAGILMKTKFPKGPFEFITTFDINELLEKYQFFVITCKVELKKQQQIPMLSYKDESGVRKWTNLVEGEITIDRITCENIIRFQDAKIYDIKYGVGIDKKHGFNIGVNSLVKRVYEARLEAKRMKNDGMSNSYKLKNNAVYGGLGLKDTEYKIKYIRGEKDFYSFIANNYFKIKKAYQLDNEDKERDRYRIKHTKAVIGNWNSIHLAMVVLSESKQQMYEVFDVANENNISIFMVDTDSIHMLDKDTQKLGDKFKEKYGRELIGNYAYQYHNDFKSENLTGRIWSKKFIGLGKKAYLDILTDESGKEDYHIRFKGAHSSNILSYCKETGISVEEFYTKLYNGQEVTLDICKGKVRFEFDDASVKTKKTMIKKFKFLNDKEKEDRIRDTYNKATDRCKQTLLKKYPFLN